MCTNLAIVNGGPTLYTLYIYVYIQIACVVQKCPFGTNTRAGFVYHLSSFTSCTKGSVQTPPFSSTNQWEFGTCGVLCRLCWLQLTQHPDLSQVVLYVSYQKKQTRVYGGDIWLYPSSWWASWTNIPTRWSPQTLCLLVYKPQEY